ncbi:hypothetical protein KAU33_05225 [Candidatus Dependentiae bacterium]|nr:hypothetical protein [Candidatus Dependentiae bacterium]
MNDEIKENKQYYPPRSPRSMNKKFSPKMNSFKRIKGKLIEFRRGEIYYHILSIIPGVGHFTLKLFSRGVWFLVSIILLILLNIWAYPHPISLLLIFILFTDHLLMFQDLSLQYNLKINKQKKINWKIVTWDLIILFVVYFLIRLFFNYNIPLFRI